MTPKSKRTEEKKKINWISSKLKLLETGQDGRVEPLDDLLSQAHKLTTICRPTIVEKKLKPTREESLQLRNMKMIQ